MPQIFRPGANTIAKVSLLAFATTPIIAIYGGSWFSNSPYNTKVEAPLDQPVPFSHRHHAWELGIDCRYCHVSVEKSSFAGIPPTETCMSCHSQIWTNSPLLEPVRKSYETGEPIKFQSDGSMGWLKVNKVPEFVYFNHSIHVNRGINCNTCHGPVQKMHITFKGNQFQMRWCLECHRNPEKYVYKDDKNPSLSPAQQVFNLYEKQQTGEELSAREKRILSGKEQLSTDPKDIEEGHKLLREAGVKKDQLADCSVCHH